jgi:glyoxylase-like metal-dependent hydrolase (beta-lactamase superfamily II)
MTFADGEVTLRVGKKNLIISTAPGHSNDGIAVLVEEDRIFFAGDSFMPLPYIVDGDVDDIMASIKKIGRMGLENIVQGHGDVILRGEIDAAVRENLNYLNAIKKSVRAAARRKNAEELIEQIAIEDCGKSRVYLGGLAEPLHRRNLQSLLQKMS